MPKAFVRITSRPLGGAPEEIRDQWIGLVLPVEEESDGPLANLITHQRVDRISGYVVLWDDAMRILGEKSPSARYWWSVNVRKLSRLVFDKKCCEVLPD